MQQHLQKTKTHMKPLTLLLLIILTMSACKSRQVLPKQIDTKTTIKESTMSKLEVIDTLQVLRPADTARISRLIKELTEIPSVIKSKQSTVSIRRVGDQIEATCVCEELKQAVKIYKETVTLQKEIITEKTETITILQNQMNWFQKAFFYLGIGVAVFAGVMIYKQFTLSSAIKKLI